MKSVPAIIAHANRQKFLTPGERSVYRFLLALVVLIPSSLILAGLAALLAWVHTSLPWPWLWPILSILLPALLAAGAKYYTAQGDTTVGALLLELEQGASQDTSADAPQPPQSTDSSVS